MRLLLLLAAFLFVFSVCFAGTNATTIQGGKVTIRGGYMTIGPSQHAVVVSTSTTGQCMGMLCGVTYPQ